MPQNEKTEQHNWSVITTLKTCDTSGKVCFFDMQVLYLKLFETGWKKSCDEPPDPTDVARHKPSCPVRPEPWFRTESNKWSSHLREHLSLSNRLNLKESFWFFYFYLEWHTWFSVNVPFHPLECLYVFSSYLISDLDIFTSHLFVRVIL